MKKFILNLLSIFDKSFWHLEVGESSKRRLLSFEKSITPIIKINLKTSVLLEKVGIYMALNILGAINLSLEIFT